MDILFADAQPIQSSGGGLAAFLPFHPHYVYNLFFNDSSSD